MSLFCPPSKWNMFLVGIYFSLVECHSCCYYTSVYSATLHTHPFVACNNIRALWELLKVILRNVGSDTDDTSGWWEVGAQIVNNNKTPPNLNLLTDTLKVRNPNWLFQPCQVLPRSLKVLKTYFVPYRWLYWLCIKGVVLSSFTVLFHFNSNIYSIIQARLNHCSDWERHTALSCFQSHALCSSHYTAFSCVKWVPEATTNPKQSCNVGCSDMRYNFSPRQQASSVCQGMVSLPTGRKLYAAINWWIHFFTCPLEMVVWLWIFPGP